MVENAGSRLKERRDTERGGEREKVIVNKTTT